MNNRLLKILEPHRRSLVLIMTFQLSIALLVAVQPLYMQQLVGLVIEGDLDRTSSRVLSLALMLTSLLIAVALCQALSGYVAALFSSDLLRDLQTAFFNKTTHLPLTYFQNISSGEFFTRFNHDVGQAQSLIANILPTIAREVITALVLVGMLLFFCPWQLVLAGILMIAAAALLSLQCHRLLERYAVSQRAGWSEINKQFDETVRGIDTVKTFGTEALRHKTFQQRTMHFRTLSANAGKVSALFSPVIELVVRIGSLALLVLAGLLMVDKQIDLDTLLLFFFCASLLQGTVTALFSLYTQLPPQLLAVQNLSDFFAENEESAQDCKIEPADSAADIDQAMDIEFRGLYFAYPEGRELYGGLDITLPARGISLIQGANGSGKSTLINLLLKFNDPEQGVIIIGGKPLSCYERQTLRKKISVVTQYHHIFNDSLRENLLVANPDASDGEISEALDAAGLNSFVKLQPKGLDQVLDSTGRMISGGERQRICIARLLLRKSPILILDEPWSNLDDFAGLVLAQSLEKMSHDCTIVVIAHQRGRFKMDYKKLVSLDSEKPRKNPVERKPSAQNIGAYTPPNMVSEKSR